MTDKDIYSLLPEGLRDIVPPESEMRDKIKEELYSCFFYNGYDNVSPPLVEYEETLISGMGKTSTDSVFKFSDPENRKTLVLRSDITTQIGRISSTRLKSLARPLRLMYIGDIVRTKGSVVRPERQFTQIGLELIGSDNLFLDIEPLVVAIEALKSIGIEQINLDLSLPNLIELLFAEQGFSNKPSNELLSAFEQRDKELVSELAGDIKEILLSFIRFSGPLGVARNVMDSLLVSKKIFKLLENLFLFADKINNIHPSIETTIDFCEKDKSNYHNDVNFRLFCSKTSLEIGRGGKYLIYHDKKKMEQASGITLFLESIVDISKEFEKHPCILMPFGTDRTRIRKYISEGYRVRISGDSKHYDQEYARRLGCTHIIGDGKLITLSQE